MEGASVPSPPSAKQLPFFGGRPGSCTPSSTPTSLAAPWHSAPQYSSLLEGTCWSFFPRFHFLSDLLPFLTCRRL